jgi:drug/metabolite transporter (DMT)-like permease
MADASMLVSILLGGAAAVGWGTAQLLGGRAARRHGALPMALGMQAAGLVPLLLLVALLEGAPDEPATLLWAVLGGAAGAGTLASFYRAVRVGALSVVAPLVGAGIAVPVVVGLLRGDAPSPLAALGLVALVCGALLVGVPRAPDATTAGRDGRPAGRPVAWALLAALLSGAFYLGLDASAGAGPLSAVAAARVAAILVLSGALVGLGRRWPRSPAAARAVILVGLVDVAANVFFTLGTDVGLLAVVAATGALYPLVAVILARVVLGERLSGPQSVGVGVVVVALAVVAAG